MKGQRIPTKEFEELMANHQGDVWFISDTHFSHRFALNFCNRDFLNVSAHDKFLMKEWNNLVKPDDIIFHLGDFGFSERSESYKLLDSLNGIKVLIKGNHDRGHRVMMNAGFDFSFNRCWYNDYYMIHDRNKINPKDEQLEYRTVLAGHTHFNEKFIFIDSLGKCGINLCVDAWDYKPVNITEIDSFVSKHYEKLIIGNHGI